MIDTDKRVEDRLNELGSQGSQVVGVRTKKQLLIAPPAAIILIVTCASYRRLGSRR